MNDAIVMAFVPVKNDGAAAMLPGNLLQVFVSRTHAARALEALQDSDCTIQSRRGFDLVTDMYNADALEIIDANGKTERFDMKRSNNRLHVIEKLQKLTRKSAPVIGGAK